VETTLDSKWMKRHPLQCRNTLVMLHETSRYRPNEIYICFPSPAYTYTPSMPLEVGPLIQLQGLVWHLGMKLTDFHENQLTTVHVCIFSTSAFVHVTFTNMKFEFLQCFDAVGWAAPRQEGHPACTNWVVGCWRQWRGYLSGARCRLAYGPADATATHCLLLQ